MQLVDYVCYRTDQSTVVEALRLISSGRFDVLVSDLSMPAVGDGLTVISAMRHANPEAVTILLSGFSAVQEGAEAILGQVDEILVKPLQMAKVVKRIRERLEKPKARNTAPKEQAATILARYSAATIENWLFRSAENEELRGIALADEERSRHLPLLLADGVKRLVLNSGAAVPVSVAAYQHGELRRGQGYTIAMMVEESRILQVSIFSTLQKNMDPVDFETVISDVMTIADEVDAQLKQAVLGFSAVH